MIQIVMCALLLIGCSPPKEANSEFDKWYEQVINEPYDPQNGSKY